MIEEESNIDGRKNSFNRTRRFKTRKILGFGRSSEDIYGSKVTQLLGIRRDEFDEVEINPLVRGWNLFIACLILLEGILNLTFAKPMGFLLPGERTVQSVGLVNKNVDAYVKYTWMLYSYIGLTSIYALVYLRSTGIRLTQMNNTLCLLVAFSLQYQTIDHVTLTLLGVGLLLGVNLTCQVRSAVGWLTQASKAGWTRLTSEWSSAEPTSNSSRPASVKEKSSSNSSLEEEPSKSHAD